MRLVLSITSFSDSSYLNYTFSRLLSYFSYNILFSLLEIFSSRSPYAAYLLRNLFTNVSASVTPVEILIVLNADSTTKNLCIYLSILSLSSFDTILFVKYSFSQLFSLSSLSCIALSAISTISLFLNSFL